MPKPRLAAAFGVCLVAVSSSALQAGQPASGALNVVPPLETCLVADEYPRISATITPIDAVQVARVFFTSAQDTSFFYVDMKREGEAFVGVLPKPKLAAGPITFYVEGTNKAATPFPTSPVKAQVVEKASDCSGRPAPAAPDGAPVTVGSVSGVAPIGFTGIAALSSATASAGGVGIGGFLTSTAGIVTTAAVAAGGVTAIIIATDDEKPASPSR